MDNKEKLIAFFEAENNRDWKNYRQFLHPNVRWTLHSTEEHIISGIDAYLTTMMKAYTGSDNTFVCESLYQSNTGNRIVTILANSINEYSCDIFEFKDGLICEEYEFVLK